MKTIYDVIVVGARCGGAATSLLLAKRGYKVLMVDKATFPSDTISTHIVFPPGVDFLKRWNILDDILATNCPVIHKMNLHPGPLKISGVPLPVNGTSTILGPRRIVMDKILIDHAVRAGVDFREDCKLESLTFDGERVSGIRYSNGKGSLEERCRVVIGADGRNSLVARSVKAPVYEEKPVITCLYYTYFSGVPMKELSLLLLDHQGMAMVPTHDDQVCIPQSWPIEQFKTIRSDIEGNYMRSFKKSTLLSELMANAKREDKFYGMTDLPNFFRKPYGPGWALVGDAAHHKDPIAGQGIMDAFISAELVVDALHRAFSGQEDYDSSLSKYETTRNECMIPKYHFSSDFAKLEPPSPEMAALMEAVSRQQKYSDQFLGVIAGTVPVEAFFNPENINRITSKKIEA